MCLRKHIQLITKKDKDVIQIAKTDKNYNIKQFHGTGKKYYLICLNNKIVIPKQLQRHIVQWYHGTLSHPGETRTELTIAQHFYWKNLRKTVQDVCSTCDVCQRL